MVGKRQRGASEGAETPQEPINPPSVVSVVVAAVKSNAATTRGIVENTEVYMMLDSGSSVSLIQESVLKDLATRKESPPTGLTLVSAAGEDIPVLGCVTVTLSVGTLQVTHPLIIVPSLIAPVILGLDFLQKHGLVLDFTASPVKIRSCTNQPTCVQDVKPLLDSVRQVKNKICAVKAIAETTEESIDDCAVPLFGKNLVEFDMPVCAIPTFLPILNDYKSLFRTSPGRTTVAEHFIPTTGTPVKVPPRRIPANYRAEVESQIQFMLQEGIIEESSSPWLAPTVFVRKKNGEIRICIDYRELNKRTVKDSYPLPRPDEVQDKLAGSAIFSTIDLRSGYWQLPLNPADRIKTAFSPGPGLGLFQFCRMPFGLAGAPASFQRLMDSICRDLPFVTTYLDDVLIHSSTIQEHEQHLKTIFERFKSAGLTLRGGKCNIGVKEVKYLGHVFSEKGMEPDPQKTSAVRDWPTPVDVSNLRSFLGLASYYRRYIHQFAEIAGPLHHLTNKGVPFIWSGTCQAAFVQLKEKLTQAPVLTYPFFGPSADPFSLQTDASSTGIGAILEQGGHVVAYASRTLSPSERNYSVIQRECLAIIFALKQFRHYLLGRKFSLLTDHAPLQWLSSQKMEGLLARWALAAQEYTFTIMYRSGSANKNADALSRKSEQCDDHSAATSFESLTIKELQQHQAEDPLICQLRDALLHSSMPPTDRTWSQPPLRRYRQLWSQLLVKDGLVCRQYSPGPTSDLLTVPIIPISYQPTILHQYHDQPQAGHLGPDKTAARVRQVGYWVGMLQDIDQYCWECTICQVSKSSSPQKAPLQNIPIGKPWEMVGVDILQVPISSRNNQYLLVIQDYFTKWAEAIPIPDQSARRITKELITVFSHYGLPDILHSDQGRNFESSILRQTLEAFGVKKTRTTAYHPQGDGMVERFNRSLLQLLRAYVEHQTDWEQYLPYVLFAYRSAIHTSTGVSPFELMFGRPPVQHPLPSATAYDAVSYQRKLRSTLSRLYDFVETHLAQAAQKQKSTYDHNAVQRSFTVGEQVWLSSPTAGKLDPKWEGKWRIQSIQGPTTYTITDGDMTRTVHINRLRRRIQPIPLSQDAAESSIYRNWEAPVIEQYIFDGDEPESRYPTRNRRPPDRFHY